MMKMNQNRICKIQETYDPSEVPVNKKITIQSTANIFDISDVDEKNHFVAIYLQMEHVWVDSRFRGGDQVRHRNKFLK